jgi:ABC-type proline/glycine betaine transport system permease subunit
LQRTYAATPDPKLVVAVGDCGCTGGIFAESAASLGRVANVIPVDVAVPGCPPSPTRILTAILTAISRPPAGICGAHDAAHARALVLSLLFTFTYATWAAKSERAGKLLVPILDILQSVPILGFISITVVFFMSLAPGRVLGAEFARSSRFSPARPGTWRSASTSRCAPCRPSWTRPRESFRLAVDALLAARGAVRHAGADLEHDDVDVGRLVLRGRLRGDQRRQHHRRAAGRRLLHRARDRAEESHAIGWAIGTMLIVILLYDQLLFRPLVAWAIASASSRSRARACRNPGRSP